MDDVIVKNSPLRQDPSLAIDNSFAEDFTDIDDDSWRFPLLAQSICGQDTRADLGRLEASHGQRRPTSSEDTPLLRQHDEGTSRHESASAPFYIDFPSGQCARMCCATVRAASGAKDAVRR
jgi:hypothetical protein